jgi:uncharacterized membrane protein
MHRVRVPSFLAAILATSLSALAAGCTLAERQVLSSAAPVACTLVALFAGGNGQFAGTVCQDVSNVLLEALSHLPSVRAATAPCTQLAPLSDPSGRMVGYVCPAYLDLAKGALAGKAP